MVVCGEAVEGGADAPVRFISQGLQLGPLGDLDHNLRIQGMHQGRVGLAAHDHVAGQQQADLGFQFKGLVGQLGVAGPKDHIRVGVVAERLGVPRPSYSHLRRVIREERALRAADRERREQLRKIAGDVIFDLLRGKFVHPYEVAERVWALDDVAP